MTEHVQLQLRLRLRMPSSLPSSQITTGQISSSTIITIYGRCRVKNGHTSSGFSHSKSKVGSYSSQSSEAGSRTSRRHIKIGSYSRGAQAKPKDTKVRAL